MTRCTVFVLSSLILAGFALRGRCAETNSGALPPTEFQLTSQPPSNAIRKSEMITDSVARSNAVKVLEHRAAIVNDLRKRQASTNGSVRWETNRPLTLQGRIEELRRKKADGMLSPREAHQLQQLELMAARTAKTNAPAQPGATIPAAK